MIIQELRIKNYRSIKDATLVLGDLTALVGRNGAGKSNFLSALALFFNPATKSQVEDADHYGRDSSATISIGLTFGGLSDADIGFFGRYVQGGVLRVTRLFDSTHDGTFHGEHLQLPKFKLARNAGRASDKKKEYDKLREAGFSDLPKVARADQVEGELAKWEEKHCDDLQLDLDDGQFFGYTNIGGSALRQRISFLHIPAVRDAKEDATDGRGSSISEVVNELFRSQLEQSDGLVAIRESTAKQYDQLVTRTAEEHLPALESDLSGMLQEFSPGNEVALALTDSDEFRIPSPQIQVDVTEDGYKTSVERTGHGTQRAFIFSVLRKHAEVLDAARGSDEPTEANGDTRPPSVFLAIEEPELYQHPTRQRHIATTLRQLTDRIPGSNEVPIQVMYTTHSPQFVSLDRCDDVRVVRKPTNNEGGASATTVSHAKFDDVIERLRTVDVIGKLDKSDAVRGKLKAVSNVQSNEGVFARCIVLVEGGSDRAVLRAIALRMNREFDMLDITVIPCGGKNDIPKLLVLFQMIQVPTFVIWDDDDEVRNGPSRATRRIEAALAKDNQASRMDEVSMKLRQCLERTLENDLGTDMWCSVLNGARKEFDVDPRCKAQAVYNRAVGLAYERGGRSETIESVVEKVCALTKR